MKKFAYTLATVALMASTAFAQHYTSCGYNAPVTENILKTSPVALTGYTEATNLTTAGTFPNVEYLVTKVGTSAGGNAANGDVIIGSTVNGVFQPSQMNRYGITLADGDTFAITAFGYSLTNMQGLVERLLTGTLPLVGTSCCTVIGAIPEANNFCGSLANNNITRGSDMQNISQVLTLFDALNGANSQLSIKTLAERIEWINTQGNTPIFPAACGRNDLPICFGTSIGASTKYVVGEPIGVKGLNANTNFVVFPNPTNAGNAQLMIDASEAIDLQVNIYNTLGQRVQQQNLGTVQGQISIALNTMDFTAGLYMVELTNGEQKQVQKLIIR